MRLSLSFALSLSAGLVLQLAPGIAGANTWIRADEVTRPRAQSKLVEAFNPAAPEIVVDSPDQVAEALVPPVRVLIRFVPKNGAKIVANSVRVLYVTFFSDIDITDRIRDKITAAGIQDDKANLPSGRHRLIIKVSDDRGEQGSKELSVDVR